MPSQYPISGYYRPASETPFGWRFACGPIVARFYVLTIGIRRLITNSSGTKTAQEILDEQLMRACVSQHSLLKAGMKMQFLSQMQAYSHYRAIHACIEYNFIKLKKGKYVMRFKVHC